MKVALVALLVCASMHASFAQERKNSTPPRCQSPLEVLGSLPRARAFLVAAMVSGWQIRMPRCCMLLMLS
jgi:hypothetical protein